MPLPRGASRDELASSFTGWDVIDDAAADSSCMTAPVKRTALPFCRLRRTC